MQPVSVVLDVPPGDVTRLLRAEVLPRGCEREPGGQLAVFFPRDLAVVEVAVGQLADGAVPRCLVRALADLVADLVQLGLDGTLGLRGDGALTAFAGDRIGAGADAVRTPADLAVFQREEGP